MTAREALRRASRRCREGDAVSRDSYSICRDCNVYQNNGTVFTATAMDHFDTLAAFDAELAKHGLQGKPFVNGGWANTRAFLVKHDGHRIEYWSSDWYYDEDDPLQGLVEVKVTP